MCGLVVFAVAIGISYGGALGGHSLRLRTRAVAAQPANQLAVRQALALHFLLDAVRFLINVEKKIWLNRKAKAEKKHQANKVRKEKNNVAYQTPRHQQKRGGR